jgi:hypothetical protein
MKRPLSDQPTPNPDAPSARSPSALSPKQVEQGELEIQDWNRMFTAMEARERSPLCDPERLRTVAIWGCVVLCFAVFALLLTGRSGAPWALIGGAVAATLSVWAYSCADVRTPLIGPICAALALAGGFGLITGLMTPKPEPVVVAEDEEELSPLQKEMQRDMESMEALIMNRSHVPVTERYRPAQVAELERQEMHPETQAPPKRP